MSGVVKIGVGRKIIKKFSLYELFLVYILLMGYLAYSTRLTFREESDKDKLVELLEAARFTWNECSKVHFHEVSKNSIVELHSKFYGRFREQHDRIPAQVVVSSQRSVLGAYKSTKSNKHKLAEPAIKKKLSFQLDKRTYSYKNRTFSLITLRKRVKCSFVIYPKLEELLNKYIFGDPLIFERGGDIWITFTFNTSEAPPQQTLAIGIDLGCRVPAATSEGNLYIDKKFNAEKRRLRYLKRQLQSTAAKGSKSAKRHLKKLRRKEASKNRNFSHNLSKKIIEGTKADTLVLENLKSIKVKKNKHQNKNRVSQVPLYQLKQFLTYKALLAEKTVIEVCPSYTSQIDSQTGKRDGTRKGRRYYSQSGKIYDADINGAINIGLRSQLPISQTSRLTYGQATVNSPIVS